MELIKANPVSEVSKRILAIVTFGPPTDATGTRAGDYYQVTVDPDKRSPQGDYIRFGLYPGDEINGWQRCSAIWVVEELMSAEQVKYELEVNKLAPNVYSKHPLELAERYKIELPVED